jgi:hypothetical protein
MFKSYRTGHVPAATWMTHPPCSWHPGPSSTYSVSDNLTLFYIDHRLIVVYIVLVDYLVSKCDSEAARGKLNSLSDPSIHRVRFRARSIIVSYCVIVLLSYCIILYQRKNTENVKREKRTTESEKE